MTLHLNFTLSIVSLLHIGSEIFAQTAPAKNPKSMGNFSQEGVFISVENSILKCIAILFLEFLFTNDKLHRHDADRDRFSSSKSVATHISKVGEIPQELFHERTSLKKHPSDSEIQIHACDQFP